MAHRGSESVNIEMAPLSSHFGSSVFFLQCLLETLRNTIYTLPAVELFYLDFQFESVFNLEFQPKFGIQLGIPIPMGINLGECNIQTNVLPEWNLHSQTQSEMLSFQNPYWYTYNCVNQYSLMRGGYRGVWLQSTALEINYVFFRLQNFKNCLTTVYSLTFKVYVCVSVISGRMRIIARMRSIGVLITNSGRISKSI